MRRFHVLAVIVCLCMSALTSAQELPKKDPQPPAPQLPAPRELPPSPLPSITIRVVPGPQLGQRAVWELYGVDSRGRFVPRVVSVSSGSYYLSNGRPYPWTTINPLPYMPYASD